MSSPSSVGDGNLGSEVLVDIDRGAGDLLPKASHLADLFEVKDLARLVTVNAQTGRVITTVLLAGETSAKNLKDFLTTLETTNFNVSLTHEYIFDAKKARKTGTIDVDMGIDLGRDGGRVLSSQRPSQSGWYIDGPSHAVSMF